MIEQVLNPRNLQYAIKKVISNKGSAGIDGMRVKELKPFLKKNKGEMLLKVYAGKYQVQPILGVEIPKENGKTRTLGIPTVRDRLLQQAVLQIVSLKYEQSFSEDSFGFRYNKNAQKAVLQSQRYLEEGYRFVIDIDLKNFFDEVDHSILLELLYQKIKCKKTLRLIRKWLRAPIEVKGKLTKRRKGVPQGSPLSPFLSNVLLHELDEEIKRRELKYVRYADDFSVYVKNKAQARKIGNELYLFLKNKLKLPINREKSGIRKPLQFNILGYKYVSSYVKGSKGYYQLTVQEKKWKTLKQKLKEITRKTSPKSFIQRIKELKEVYRGWINYFRMAHIGSKLKELDKWLRNRLRYCIWHHWKKPERKRKNLIRLGLKPNDAYAWSRTRMGGWAVAQSPILKTTLTISKLKKRGYEPMFDYYQKISFAYNEPLYTRPVRTVV
jgi:RNA-directed DNA polymerase